jgi:hypothetical protein
MGKLHSDWCSSLGFKEVVDEEMVDLVAKLDLDVQRKSLKQSMKDAIFLSPCNFQ